MRASLSLTLQPAAALQKQLQGALPAQPWLFHFTEAVSISLQPVTISAR